MNDAQKTIVSERAIQLGIEPEKLLAFIQVEANGRVSTGEPGVANLPMIRWEGHYFDRLVPKHLQATARAKGLASPTVGGIKNPKTQKRRYEMLSRAKSIDVSAAICSTSYGIGQVMGENWKSLGYKSAVDFERSVSSGFRGQLDAMIRFIEVNNLVPHLKRGDWSAVARIYNGPRYAKGGYHIKMANAYLALKKADHPITPTSAGMLRAGSSGPRVRELQHLLVRAGFSVKIDGDFGPSTERAVRVFQKNHSLEIDGVVGKETLKSLEVFKESQTEELGETPMLENQTVKEGVVGGLGGTAVLVSAKETLDNATDQISYLAGSPILDYVSTGLAVASAVVALAGLGYVLYGLWNKDKSYGGIEDSKWA